MIQRTESEGGVTRSLVGFAAARSGDAFVIHIVDDAAEVFEIQASRENLELIVTNLQSLIDESAAAPPGSRDEDGMA